VRRSAGRGSLGCGDGNPRRAGALVEKFWFTLYLERDLDATAPAWWIEHIMSQPPITEALTR
jgi:hypothetical protein